MSSNKPCYGTHAPLTPLKIQVKASQSGAEEITAAIRPSLLPVAGWRMDYSRFDFDSSVIIPSAREELPNLRKLMQEHKECPLSLFGHTDPSGQDVYNKKLSGRRALALYGLLTGDTELWEKLYKDESTGDKWGYKSIQIMLGALKNSLDMPYYSKEIDGIWGSGSIEALTLFQEDHPGELEADGKLGPLSREVIFREYMDYLRTDDKGNKLEVAPGGFLAQGADDGLRGDVQGCSEYNPLMVFSAEEDKEFQKPSKKEDRNLENSVNRRVVVYIYPKGSKIEPEEWPCPKALEGAAECTKRFWSDGNQRRNPKEARRHFDGDSNTFACRFYHRTAYNSQAEQPESSSKTFDLYLYVPAGKQPGAAEYKMSSSDGAINRILTHNKAVLMDREEEMDIYCLSFTGLTGGKTYTLSSYQEGEESYNPIALMKDFKLEDFEDSKNSDEDKAGYYVERDTGYLRYNLTYPDWESIEREPVPGDEGEDLFLEEESEEIEWDDMKITVTTIKDTQNE